MNEDTSRPAQINVLDDALTIEEIASLTGRNPVTLREWARLGILPGKRLGERIYIVSRSLFLASLTDGSLADRFSAREVAEIKAKLEPKSK